MRLRTIFVLANLVDVSGIGHCEFGTVSPVTEARSIVC